MKVTEFGDVILPYKPVVGCAETYEPDPNEKMQDILIHTVCFGFVDVIKTSERFNVLRCRSCGLRVPYLNTAETYKEVEDSIGCGISC